MRGYDVIRELYQGNLRPCDRGFRSDTDFSITMDAFTAHETWLQENLSDEASKRFEELISCYTNIVDTVSYENFRTGFRLGMMMVMEAVNENETTFFEL